MIEGYTWCAHFIGVGLPTWNDFNLILTTMKEKEKRLMAEGFNKVIFYIMNFRSEYIELPNYERPRLVPSVIAQCNFECGKENVAYSFLQRCDSGAYNTGSDALLSLYFELSGSDRRLFCEWIADNYDGERSL